MANKKTVKSKPQSGVYYGVRCSDEDSAEFGRATFLEGFSSVQQWLLAIGRKRARAIVAASEAGESINISEVIVTPRQK